MPIVVGVSEIRYRRYAVLDAIGALIWAVGVTSLGLILGATLKEAIDIDKYIYPVVAVVVVLSLVPVALEYRASRRRDAARMEA
jgi:membrane-associated protein